ncbi:hypothetical protein BDZ89DRAFT_1099279 [Hymenopellis radicata]|nr:hypothetical protein BDZ89DRAFT_1099279 [Hymenopellis radicata]
MQSRPDRPLIVKCTFDRWNKRITFSSAKNCTYILLRHKVEQCFSLSASAYAITYKDDDGEVTDIRNEMDLTEAIQYFQAGTDDPPLSSAASILSGRSFGSRKITLRVHISVDYDGPSLSDTSSVISLDEYRSRNGSELSFSFGTPSVIEPDDDSVTVSSKDTGMHSRPSSAAHLRPTDRASQLSGESSYAVPSGRSARSRSPAVRGPRSSRTTTSKNPFGDEYEEPEPLRYPADPSAVLERLKLREQLGDDSSSVNYNDPISTSNRGTQWLRDQNQRAVRAKLGVLPAPSETDDSLSLSFDNAPSNASIDGAVRMEKPRPTSRHLNWLAAHQVSPAEVRSTAGSHPPLRTNHSDPTAMTAIPPELYQFMPLSPPEVLTSCSECGVFLDSIRYVCSTCGEKDPIAESGQINVNGNGKGKERSSMDTFASYPPPAHRHHLSPSSHSLGSNTVVGSTDSVDRKLLPTLPRLFGSETNSSSTVNVARTPYNHGFELCSGCIESAGLMHAIEAGVAPGSSPTSSTLSPTSPEGAKLASQWRRLAPKEKGKLRHTYHEKIWGHEGWKDVEQDEASSISCSACGAVTALGKTFKCASCKKYYLCRACYSLVHNVHPSHAFLVVPDKESSTRSEPDMFPPFVEPPDPSDEEFMKHPGVKCAHCLLDIVGARFHCAICDSVDICANCESAGLPGNLDSADGGHTSSHILIKIPFPLETTEVQTASRRAIHLWTGRDAVNTVMGPLDSSDHDVLCSACAQPISGIRYQCANCPSKPVGFNLCSHCETKSYMFHDPTHVFFKLPRPVDKQIESQYPMIPKLYKVPAGPGRDSRISPDPKAYLKDLIHSTAICDRCMTCIQGAWFRCAYCGKDLCDACEELDNHNDTHLFMVFKAPVDVHAIKMFTNIDNPNESPPVIPYAVYR